jgi:5-methylcytosine-specific restriction endonuclease McrA
MAIGIPKPQRKVDSELLDTVRQQNCSACHAPAPSDPSHLISRGAGGPDADWNVAPHCRICHSKWHSMGPIRFVRLHPVFRRWLEDHGWEIDMNGVIDRRR